MISNNIYLYLASCFPNSFMNSQGEFIAHQAANEYFKILHCKDELEVKCKVLEWLSRSACKTEPFKSSRKNQEFNDFMLYGINKFLGTSFTTEDMRLIYQRLGNQVSRQLTIAFIESDYNLKLL